MLWHFQEKLHNQENLVFGWCQRGFKLYQTPQTEVPLRCVWKARSECLMSSKRKEKRSKVLTQYPCLPPQKWPIFLTLLRNFPKMKGAVTVNPLGNDFQPPPRPTENLVYSGGGGDGSGYFNGIDRHLLMVRGLLYISSKLKENRQEQQQQQHKK